MAPRVCEFIGLLFIWMIAEFFLSEKAQPLEFKNFRCNNGKYIINRYFCDGDHNNCDGSDESFGCSREMCGPNMFTCSSNSKCISITNRCDTIFDCEDNSDELYCVGDETNIKDCSLHRGKFLCTDKLRCLDYNYTCDGICHCFDCSDESSNCDKIDTDSCRSCLNFCLPTPEGSQCPCDSTTYESSKFCKNISKEIKECTDSQRCEQHCSVYRNRTRCLCYEGFHELPGSRNPHPKCRSNDWLESVLLYSTISKIKALNLTYPEKVRTIQRGFNHTSSILVLTGANNYTYYASFYDKRFYLFKTSINNGETHLITQSNSSITSLSVDWITQNIYFTSNGSLSVCSNDGKICAQLECCDDVDNVALVPDFGQMYFLKKSIFKNERNIMKSNMDGSDENFLVDASFVHPLSLAINEQKKTLYVYELSTNFLYSILLLEFNKEVSMQLQFKKYDLNLRTIGRSFLSVAAFDNSLFFTKFDHDNVISSINGNEISKSAEFHTDLETNAITNLYAYNPRFQRINESKIKNPCENVSCDGLCLLRPIQPTNQLNYTCIRQNDSSTNGTHWPLNEQIMAITKTTEDGMTNESFQYSAQSIKKYVSASTQTDHHPISMDSTSTEPEQRSKSDIMLGFMSGVALILGVIVLYFIFEKISSNRYRRKMDITELMDVQ